MQQQFKGKSGASFDATVTRRTGVRAGLRGKNYYEVKASRPLVVSDPEKLERLANDSGLVLPRQDRLILGYVPQKWVDKILVPTAAKLSFSRMREIESLLSGGGEKWRTEFTNIIVNTGLDDILTNYYKGSAYTAAFYVGLTDGTPTVAAADTMSSHAGWAEVTAYDEATRQSLTLGTVSSQSVSTSSASQFTCSTNSTTVGGAFITTDNTRGGTSGTLITVGAFSGGNKALDDGDTLAVSATLTMADDGV